jgi:hypothetical protein
VDHNKHASAGLDSEAALTICAKNQKVSSSNTRANAAGPIEMLIRNISSVPAGPSGIDVAGENVVYMKCVTRMRCKGYCDCDLHCADRREKVGLVEMRVHMHNKP